MHQTPDKLDAYFQELEAQQKFSGVIRISQGDEERFTGAYGYASRAWNRHPTPSE